jgi:hypothetical protein
MLQKLTFKSFLICSDEVIAYKFTEPIADFNKIPNNSEKKALFNWLTDSNCEKNIETITLEEFDKLFQGNFYFKLGVKIK